jgi:hypothetical protein
VGEGITHDARHSSAASDTTREVRTRAWAFAFDCYAQKEGSRPGAPDDAKGSKHDSRHNQYTRT